MHAKGILLTLILSIIGSIHAEDADFDLTAANALELGFETTVGNYYVLQKTTAVDPPAWSNYGDPILGNGKRVFGFSRTADSSEQFFRVVEYNLSDGLVAHYPLNGNANDITSNQNNGVVIGATLTTDRFGIQNAAYSFNGTNQFIQCLHKGYLNFPEGNLSVSLWVNFENNSTNRFLLGKSDGAFNENKWIVYHDYSPSKFSFHINTQSGNSSFSAPAQWWLDSNSWHHVVITKSGTTYKTYLDGLKGGESTGPATIPATTAPLTIGVVENIGWMHGKLDDIRIYNRAINNDEVRILFKESNVQLDNSLVARYEFNGNANDSTINANNGTVIGAVLTDDRFGKPNSAYHFNGLNQSIQVPNQTYLNLSSEEGTVTFWAKFEGTVKTRHILGKSEGANNNNKWIAYYSPSPSQVSLHVNRVSGGSTFSAQANFTYDTASWHHIAFTKSGSTYSTYIDGIKISQGSGPSILPATSAPLTIGVAEGLSWFQGSLDDIRIYNRALNSSEVQQLVFSE